MTRFVLLVAVGLCLCLVASTYADSHMGTCSTTDIASATTCIGKLTLPTDISDKAQMCTYQQETLKCNPQCACDLEATKTAIADYEKANPDCKLKCGSAKDWGKPEYRYCTNPYNWTELVHGYKDARVTFKSGGLGALMEDGAYEVWVCLHEHYCGDPWFCFVYHEGNKEFTAWGPNSKLDLIRETHPQDEIERLWATWSQLKVLSETTQEQVRAVGNFLYHVKEEELNEKSKPARRLSIFRGVEDARAAPSFQSNRVLVMAPWNRDDENDYPSYDDIVEYVTQTRLGATLLTEDEIRANRQALVSEGEQWNPAWYGNPSAFYVAIQRPDVMNSCKGCEGNGESGCTCSTIPENFYIAHICSWNHHACSNVQPLNHVKRDVKFQSLALIAYWSTCSHNCLRF